MPGNPLRSQTPGCDVCPRATPNQPQEASDIQGAECSAADRQSGRIAAYVVPKPTQDPVSDPGSIDLGSRPCSTGSLPLPHYGPLLLVPAPMRPSWAHPLPELDSRLLLPPRSPPHRSPPTPVDPTLTCFPAPSIISFASGHYGDRRSSSPYPCPRVIYQRFRLT
ncbi:unnamed protein product [Rhizoctonia solani]|uniref:Uncharacterized protein n=1 Tax=Rhizoctonia solani TaxID=456999 RepID=A0A8H2WMU5_9AGAM|nr:unnamed protein product [Rhizoctonia solani]